MCNQNLLKITKAHSFRRVYRKYIVTEHPVANNSLFQKRHLIKDFW